MERRTKLMLTSLFLIFLIAGLYLFTDWISKITGYFSGEAETEKLVLCLSEQDAEFYGTEFCADCEKQTNLFGKSFNKLNYVDCGRNKENCPNLREIHAWYINKNIYYGFKTIEELKEISGCEN